MWSNPSGDYCTALSNPYVIADDADASYHTRFLRRGVDDNVPSDDAITNLSIMFHYGSIHYGGILN